MTKGKDQKATASQGVDRRNFLRGVGLGAGAAGVAAVVGGASDAGAAEAPKGGRPSAGYKETDHVRRAYELARF